MLRISSALVVGQPLVKHEPRPVCPRCRGCFGCTAQSRSSVEFAIGLGPASLRSTATEVSNIDVSNNLVTIDLSNPAAAPPLSALEASLVDEIGPDVTVVVE